MNRRFQDKKVFNSERSEESRFRDMRVLIFGLGVNQGGVGSARFFAKRGAQVRVTDLKTRDELRSSIDELSEFKIDYTLGEHKNEDIDWADLIIKNPGVKPGNPYIEYGEKLGKRIELDIGIFLELVKPNKIIGVTGTKGKSTTASLIYEALKAGIDMQPRGLAARQLNLPTAKGGTEPRASALSGQDSSRSALAQTQSGSQNPTASVYNHIVFAGNIGKSVLDAVEYLKDETLVVLELSSFHLEAFEEHKVSPKWSVITNITPDHLNYYRSMSEYIQSKRSIAKNQTKQDYLFLRRGDPVTTKPDFLAGFRGKIIYFSASDLPDDFKPRLLGKHNRENIAAALAVAQTFGLNKEKTLKALEKFPGVEFRLEFIKEWKGVKIYNDTTATGPDAGIKALQALPNSILIAGGVNKNLPYQEYAKAVDRLAKKVFFLEGDATEEIKKHITRSDLVAGTYNNLEVLLEDIKGMVKSGDIVLFSPAAASFNLFQNEFDRGRKFNQAVAKIFP